MKKYKKLKSLTDIIGLNKSRKKKTHTVKKNKIPLTEEDRILFIYKQDQKSEIIEVTCVSYEILLDIDWVTIVYYDSSHGGKLHRHERISITSEQDIVVTENVLQSPSPQELLSWSIRDLTDKYLFYRENFVDRNRDYISKHGIDTYE